MTDSDRPTTDELPPPPRLVRVDDLRGETEEGASGCLRPLGLCELGGACDCCFYGQQILRRRESSTG